MHLIISFLILFFIVFSLTVFFLRRTLISGTEGALNRLNEEITKANEKQAELSQKIKQANEELAKRQQEATDLAEKMRSEAEEESKMEREKIIANARKEGEEIIAKAQGAKEKIREELEKELDVKVIECSVDILNDILSEKAKGSLTNVLVDEFLEKLKTTDMSRISSDIKEAEIISLTDISQGQKGQFESIIEKQMGRKLSFKVTIDPNLGGGVILKFGSMALDGSIKNFIREKALELQKAVEAQ